MSGLTRSRLIPIESRGITFCVYDSRVDSIVSYEHLLVLLHGCGGTSQTFGAMTASLPKSVVVIAYDARGHGKTTCEDKNGDMDLSIDSLVEDGADLLKSIIGEKEPFVLCGHSMGGVRDMSNNSAFQ